MLIFVSQSYLFASYWYWNGSCQILLARWRVRRMVLVGKSFKILLWVWVIYRSRPQSATPQVKVSEGRVVLSNQNQIKSNQIRKKKRCLMICKLQRGSDCLHPQFWPRPPPVFSIQLCCSPWQNSLILNNNNSSIFFVIIIFYGNT